MYLSSEYRFGYKAKHNIGLCTSVMKGYDTTEKR